jgi:hypothetical protein
MISLFKKSIYCGKCQFSLALIKVDWLASCIEIVANFRVELFPRSVLNIFFTYLPGSGKRQDWVYLSSEQGVFNELDFKIVIIASFESKFYLIVLWRNLAILT